MANITYVGFDMYKMTRIFLQDVLFDDNIYNAGIRYKEMKLLFGNPGKPDGWTPPPKVMDVSKDDKKIYEFTELFKTTSEIPTCEAKLVRLYNLTNDPFEKDNIANENPDIVKDLTQRLLKYVKTMISPDLAPETKKGNPKLRPALVHC